jgi:hypothetical protein
MRVKAGPFGAFLIGFFLFMPIGYLMIFAAIYGVATIASFFVGFDLSYIDYKYKVRFSGVVGIGFVLFALRRKNIIIYGLLELILSIGFLFDYCKDDWFGSPPAKTWPLFAGVYVMVRGLDNLTRGLSDWLGESPHS